MVRLTRLAAVSNTLSQLPSSSISRINPLTPDDHYRGRTSPLTSKRYILYIYSTNIGTEYFKHGIYSLFFSLQNAVCFIILTCLVPVFTFYIQGVLKLKKKYGAKRLNVTGIMLVWTEKCNVYTIKNNPKDLREGTGSKDIAETLETRNCKHIRLAKE